MNKMQLVVWILLAISQVAAAESRLEIENAFAWQTRNVSRIPSDGGTEFDLASFQRGPSYAPRLLWTWDIDETRSVRVMLFPFQTSGSKNLDSDTVFNDTTFLGGKSTDATYKFHSYRLTYRYKFFESDLWQLRAGVTGKIRNAKVELRQDDRSDSYANVGFVPLAHFNAQRKLMADWRLEFDADALAARQGRAEDVSLNIWRQINEQWELGFGGRTLEGGAANSRVYGFAWLNFVSGSIARRF